MPDVSPPLSDSILVATTDGAAYPAVFGALGTLPQHLANAGMEPGPALLVTDANVAPHYLPAVVDALGAAGWTPQSRVVPPGERSKSSEMLNALYDWALGLGVERGTPVVALGGGVVGDLAGFAAATLLRGLPLVHLPTTVVAQSDSALGGKTGINHAAGKNLIGAFYPPRLVLADAATLATLDRREFRAGLAEVVKTALVDDAAFADALEADIDALLSGDLAPAAHHIRRAAAAKAGIVSADEKEQGRRALLNFGHTFGHAIEKVAGYGHVLHGEAVATGMRAALHLSATLRLGEPASADGLPEPFGRADRLVRRLPLASLDGLRPDALTAAMGTDKKRAGGQGRFVVLDEIGRGRVAEDVPDAFVRAAWAFAGAH